MYYKFYLIIFIFLCFKIKMVKIFFLILLTSLLNQLKCNIWDNIFTNNKGPIMLLEEGRKLYFNKTIDIIEKGKKVKKNINVFTFTYSLYQNIIKISINNKISKEGVVTLANEQYIIDFFNNKVYNVIDNKCTYLKSLEQYLQYGSLVFAYENYHLYTFFNQTTTPFYEYYLIKPKVSEIEDRNFLSEGLFNQYDKKVYFLAYEILKTFNEKNNISEISINDMNNKSSTDSQILYSGESLKRLSNVKAIAKEDSFISLYFDKRSRRLIYADVFIDQNNPYYQKLVVSGIPYNEFDPKIEFNIPNKEQCTNAY
jgi:hypothetical protein